MRSNLTRSFGHLVSLEAWHSQAPEEVKTLHVDATFMEARIGEGEESKVRFRLSVKRADVTFVTPDGAGVAVIQKSVARESRASGRAELVKRGSNASSGKASGSIALQERPSLRAELSASTELSSEHSETATLSKEISEIEWRHKKDPQGYHAWEVFPYKNGSMLGKPWDPNLHPRLGFKVRGSSSELVDDPRVVVTCRREDLHIVGVEIKADNVVEKIRSSGKRNREAAAEAVIKQILIEEGLDAGRLDEKFSEIMLAETIVVKETE